VMTDASHWESMVTVGRIVRPHGHKGGVVVESATDFGEERFKPGAELSWKRGETAEIVRVATSREFRGRWVIAFEGITSMNDAETLRGLELRVPETALHRLGTDAHYVHDLRECIVSTTSGTEIGRVVDVTFGPGAPLLVLESKAGKEVLVPLAADICRTVDTDAKRIVVELPDGLLDLNR